MSKIADWDSDPVAAFEVFIRSPEFLATSKRPRKEDADLPPLSDQSVAVYSFMFQKFATWLKSRGLTMSTLDGQALYAFLDKRGDEGQFEIKSRIAHRYVRLIDRCFEHIGIHPNPAQIALRDDRAGGHRLGKDGEMDALTEAEQQRFVDALPDRTGTWKDRRNRAMQLVMLNAGLKVAEVVGLQLAEVSRQPGLDGSLRLAITPEGKHDSSYAHEAFVRAGAVEELLDWIEERRRMPLLGTLVFPANFRGDAIDRTTVYRQVRKTFERADLPVIRSGGRTLRNTFAVEEYDKDTVAELVEYLGLALPRSVDAYRLKQKAMKNEPR